MKKGLFYLLPAAALLQLTACEPSSFVPKPRGYARIQLPERKYQLFDEPGFPYSFEYPVYAKVVKDTQFFDARPENPFWVNLEFPELGGKVYMTYKSIDNQRNTFSNLVEDAYKLSVYWHSKKADYIYDSVIMGTRHPHVHGVFYTVGGNAATANQFYVTDSTQNFLRGALYFDVAPNADSLMPVNNFLKEDMWHLIETLKWK